MNIKITADSTCDLSEALLRQWNISLIPMHILMGEESYLDGVTIHPADVFAHAQNGGKMPKSAAPNLVEYTDFLAPFARDYDAVIHINVGSKFSSCFQNARLAAQEFGNVYVVDSENISAPGRAISSCRQPSGPLTACRPRTFPCAYRALPSGSS